MKYYPFQHNLSPGQGREIPTKTTEEAIESDEEGVDQPDSLVIADEDDNDEAEDGLAAFRRTVSS